MFGFQVGKGPYIEFLKRPHLSHLANNLRKQLFALTSLKTENAHMQQEKVIWWNSQMKKIMW